MEPRPKKPSQAPQPLSPERIVAAALEEIAAVGLAAFSTRKLGQRLGCEAMSIYHHFPSKQHLLDALVAQAIASVEVPPPGRDASESLERLRRAAHSYRAMAHRWPALYPLVAVHRLNMPTGVRFIESLLVLTRAVAGGDDERSARAFRTIGYYLAGACLDETSGYARGPSAAEPVSGEFIERECPLLAAAAPYFQQQHWDATFELGIEQLLAGLSAPHAEPRAQSRRATSRPRSPNR